MKITANFTTQQIRAYCIKRKEIIMGRIVERFAQVGETFITNARNNGTYKDQTGNLRSSVGYNVIRNGVQLYAGFSDQGTVIGLNASKALMNKIVKELIARNPTSIILVCVAGMKYASHVEAKGYDVITGSSLQAELDLKQAIKEVQEKIK